MSYVLTAWIAASIGFILGATWSGLGAKNKEIDKNIPATMHERHTN